MKAIRFASLIMLVAMVLVACAPAAPSSTTTMAGTPVATIPSDQLVQSGLLFFCSDIPYPPQEFFDQNGNPQGLDVDIATEIAHRLGLKPLFVNTVFDSIIPALSSGKCDAIISAMNITVERQKQISQIKYFQAGQSFVTLKGNPNKINTVMDLCGKAAAAESGTTEADYIQGTGDYAGKGLSQQCVAAGKPAITLVVAQKDTDALQQLQSGKVVIYSADSPVAAYYTVQHPDEFELAAGGQVLEAVVEGIGVLCGTAKDCTNAPLSPVGSAIETALKSMTADGTYTKILQKWNLTNGAVTLP
jgi:polar amino acid transport system substrate-binding protein